MTKEVEVGDEFPTARSSKTTTFGAFVELAKGTDGLLHISNIKPGERADSVEDVLNRGDEIEVKVVEVDRERGRIGPAPRRGPRRGRQVGRGAGSVGTGDRGGERGGGGSRDRGGRAEGGDRGGRGGRDRGRDRRTQIAPVTRAANDRPHPDGI